jgi:hypothetical protein
MEFNVKKCEVMHMGHNNMEQEYYMNGHKLEVTEEERDIGVLVTRTSSLPASAKRRQGRPRLYSPKYPEPFTTGTETSSFASTSSM